MLITQLTVVNACLASMGEEPIQSLAETNAFTNSALYAMENANSDVQSTGWYFNKETLCLRPEHDGYYRVSPDVIDLDTSVNQGWLALRGRRLYDSSKGEFYTTPGELRVHIIRLLEFDDLPYNARRMVKALTVMNFQTAYDGDTLKIATAQQEYTMARTQLRTQHIRAVKANYSMVDYRQATMVGSNRLRTPR